MRKLKVKKFVPFAITVALLLVILLLALNPLLSVILGQSIEDTGVTITPTVISNYDFEQYNGSIALVNAKGIEFYNNKGEYQADVAFKLYSPYLYTQGKYAIVADINTENAIVLKNNVQVYKIKEKQPIKSVSINKNGYAAVLTGESGYKSSVIIYDSMGNKVYTWYSGDIHVADVKVADNGKSFAVVGINVQDNLKSVVKFFKINDDNPVSEVILNSELAYQLEYSNKNAVVITDKGIKLISPNGNIKKEYSFGGNELLCFDIKNTKMPVVAISNAAGGGSKIVVLNSSLEEKRSAVVSGVVKTLDENNKSIVTVNQNNCLFFINSAGKIVASKELSDNVQRLKVADNDNIFVLSGSNIRVYKLGYGKEKGGE